MKNTKTIYRSILRRVVFVAVAVASIFAAQLLWNYVVPSLTGWTPINFWQTLALMVLGRIVTGGFGLKSVVRDYRAKQGMRAEFADMSKEEKKAYIRDYMNKKY